MTTRSHGLSHKGTVRNLNEDALLEMPKHGIWAVADGMGGHEAGDFASQLTIDTLRHIVELTPPERLSTQHIVQAITDANQQLQTFSKEQLDGQTAGTTVVVLQLKKERFYLLWVGDSRGYLLRNNVLTQQTRDHSQVNDLIDEGLIKPEEAESHPLANVITRAVGVDTEVDVDIISGELLLNDTFLLCSDGLNKEVSDDNIQQIMADGNPLDTGMALLHSALVRGAKDNVTCVIIKQTDTPELFENSDDDRTLPVFIPE